jgi:hypothetical protein
MDNNPELPEGWVMLDDMARRVQERLHRRRIAPEKELQNELVEIARDITLIDPNPADWARWVIYLLEKLEGEAQRRGKMMGFDRMRKFFAQQLVG